MNSFERLGTGIVGLDERLGGGLLPGTLTVVVGASGIGKTQFGLQFLHAGASQEGLPGIVFDVSARIDSQAHAEYARRMFDWTMTEMPTGQFEPNGFFDNRGNPGEYLHVFDQQGRRVTRNEVDFDTWHDWQAELAARLERTVEFFYSAFTRGVRRAVIDGIEPVDRPSESIQMELFQYIYHQILRKESSWVARDLFRQYYRQYAETIDAHAYDCNQISAVLLQTSHEMMLDALIERPLVDGDMLATANTLIYMGKVRDGNKLSRGLYIAKHRGSACSDEITPYTITDRGISIV